MVCCILKWDKNVINFICVILVEFFGSWRETMVNLLEQNTEKTIFSPYFFIRLRFQGYCCKYICSIAIFAGRISYLKLCLPRWTRVYLNSNQTDPCTVPALVTRGKYKPNLFLCRLGFNFDVAARLVTVPGRSRPIWPIQLGSPFKLSH